METETTARIMRTDAYIASLNIPQFNCDREDKEQVKMHMLCSMLCCPKQINEDETISAENTDLNLRQVSRLWLSLYTVGRIATDYDRVEADRIAKNLERVFQLPLFEKIVQMDGNAKFRAVPPEQILPLYLRIIRGGQWLRLRKGEQKARKDRECNTPEAVYKAKVACNFLLKLIGKERSHQKAPLVDWQLVQNRYAEMFANEHSEDRKLMEWFEAYGLEFSQPHLNSELIKSWTGRSSITKALSLPLFSKIYWEKDESTGFLRVGFGSDTELYTDEELREALDAMRIAAEEKQRIANNAIEQERYSKVFTPTEVQCLTPVQERPMKDFTNVPAVTTASSPFTNFGRHSSGIAITRKIRKHISMNEAQYIPSSDNVDESSDSFSDSDDEGPKGVYSDDEELESNLPAVSKKESTLSAGFQPTGFAVPKPDPPLVKPKPVPVAVKPYYAGRQEEIRVDATVEPFQNRWESEDDQGQARARINVPRGNHPPTSSMPMSNPAQPHSSESFDSAPRHLSAFQSCKQPGRSDKNEEGANNSHPEQAIPTNKDTRRANIDQRALYDQCENSHEKHERANSPDFGQNDRFNSQNSHYARVDRRSHPTDLLDNNSQSHMRSPEDFSSSRRESVFARSSDRNHFSTDRQNERPESRQRSYNGFKPNNVDSHFHGAKESAFSRTVDESAFRPRSVLRQTSMQSLASSRSLINEGYDSRSNNSAFQNEQHFGRKFSAMPKYSEWDDDEESRGFRNTENRQPSSHSSEEGHGRPKADFSAPTRDASRMPQSTSTRIEHDRLDDFRNRSRQSYRSEPSNDRDRDRTLSTSHPEPLTADQAARLRMIRDYTFLHRNVKELGFRTIDKISSILPPDDSINYLQLVQEHIPEIETAPFRDTYILLWKEGVKSNEVQRRHFDA
ncbi:unnamed protein product [Cylicocyclus nassatus]|uniref:Uncharacterized protein n=1 Tax=Cylicocyclus nassatus TaxID=53992 RepID=A0AA36DRX9_CYLNA|nr:unnamed protein product [Cylicocyclus nassatus]